MFFMNNFVFINNHRTSYVYRSAHHVVYIPHQTTRDHKHVRLPLVRSDRDEDRIWDPYTRTRTAAASLSWCGW